jgi:hypothetical protein
MWSPRPGACSSPVAASTSLVILERVQGLFLVRSCSSFTLLLNTQYVLRFSSLRSNPIPIPERGAVREKRGPCNTEHEWGFLSFLVSGDWKRKKEEVTELSLCSRGADKLSAWAGKRGDLEAAATPPASRKRWAVRNCLGPTTDSLLLAARNFLGPYPAIQLFGLSCSKRFSCS